METDNIGLDAGTVLEGCDTESKLKNHSKQTIENKPLPQGALRNRMNSRGGSDWHNNFNRSI